jgi:alanine dehydrogenase
MKIGIPKEIKDQEYRVGATPAMVRALVEAGHELVVEQDAGAKIGFLDHQYTQAGAQIVASPADIYAAEMVVKVKEPQASEFPLIYEGLILFCYLHLAPDPMQTAALLKSKVIGIAYETVTDAEGRLPLLIPMSEIAGRLSIQVGATYLQMNKGGKGLLLGGVPGVLPASVLIVGGGVVGTEAARMALGLGANVTVLDKNLNRLRELDALFGPALHTLFSSKQDLEETVKASDLVIGAVLIPGKTSPKLITKAMVESMQPGSVIVDVAIDQGGCAETSRPTTHSKPTYLVDGVVHYCVTNIPGACARTSTLALTHATFAYVLELANKGWRSALRENKYLCNGLNVCLGHVTNSSIAYDLGYEYVEPEKLL